MKSCDLTEVGARLEEAVKRVTDNSFSPLLLYQCYEMTAITMLDSEHACYPDGHLMAYLNGYLSAKSSELGIFPSVVP
jgi:hypothetical protein